MILRAFSERDLKKIRALYREAFPLNERAPFSLLIKRARQGRADCLVAVDHGVFCGFFYVLTYCDLAYIFYFAVQREERGKGRGSEMLALLKRYYADKRLFLALESIEEAAPNAEERLRRWRFYEKNGFSQLPGHIKEGSVVFDVMGIGGAVSSNDYEHLILGWCGKWYRRVVDLRLMD